MANYRLRFAYRSDGMALEAGDVVDLPDDLAAWMLRDAPGCLVAMADDQTPPPEPEPEPRAVEEPPQDRMLHRPSRKRRT